MIDTPVRLHQFTPDCITDEYVGWLNDKQLMRFSRQSKIVHSHESCLKYLKTFQGTANLFWSVRNADNLQIGTMTAYVNTDSQEGDIGILIAHQSVRGKGFARLAWGLAMSYLFDRLSLKKVTGGTLAPHARMISIFEGWGMRREAILPNHEVLSDTTYDVVRYSITKAEWDSLPNRPSIVV